MLKNISLLILSILLAILLLEIFLRVFKLAPEISRFEVGRFQLSNNPLIGMEPIPYSQSNMGSNNYDDHLKMKEAFNSLGFRDTEPHFKKEDTLQILFLGDSISMGERIGDLHEAYVKLVEKKLRNDNYSIQSINFAVSGYNTVQEVETLNTKGLAYKPDIVVLQYCYNDEYGSSDGQRTLKTIEGLKLKSISLERFLLSRLSKSALARLITASLPLPHVSPNDYYYELLNPDRKKAIEKLLKLSIDHNFEVIMFIFPTMDMINNNEIAKESNLKNYFEDIDIEYYFLRPAFEMCAYDNENRNINLFDDYFHPNEAGHKCAANFIKKILVEKITNNPAFNKYRR